MGRTPLSMLLLAWRLKSRGHAVHLFGYSPTFETLDGASSRLVRRVHDRIGSRPYALGGHSLGTVIFRHALPGLGEHPPAVCFLLAPPLVACRAARFFAPCRLYQLLTGEMGQLLAREEFMRRLPLPERFKIYAGTCGPRASWLPFGHEANDGILSVEEASGDAGAAVVKVPSTHTFIMNSAAVFRDMAVTLEELAP
jgi:hypothetical protein